MNGTNRPDGVREMVKMALLMAMNCVSAYVIIPLPFSLSPISLQTVFVNLLGFLLTPFCLRRGRCLLPCAHTF